MSDLARLARLAVERRAREEQGRLRNALREYGRWAWPLMHPTMPMVWGWHLDCMYEHLEAVWRRYIRTLVINIAPRHLKSTTTTVVFPGFLWANDPSVKLLTGSYAMPLATRDATATRRLITHPEHQRTFPWVQLAKDQNEKTRYELARTIHPETGQPVGGGARYCFSTGGTVTGEGGDLLIWDDPHKARDMYSAQAMETAELFWKETLPSRLNDPMNATTIVVMQRLGPKDITGHIMAEAAEDHDSDVVHVVLPTHYDPKRHLQTRWFEDPRTKPGELLWPERMNEAAVRQTTKKMSPQAIAAQYEQSPISQSGAIFPRRNWRVWTDWTLPVCSVIAISHDAAMKDREINDRWATHVWGAFEHPDDGITSLILLNAWADHMTYPTAKRRLLQTVADWTLEGEPPDHVIIEDKAAGPALLNELGLAGIKGLVAYNPGKRSKMERFQLQSDLLYTGRVWVPGKKLGDRTRSSMILPTWAEDVVAEMEAIGTPGAPDDHGDAAAQAWHLLRDIELVPLDTDVDDDDEVDARPVLQMEREPLYG